MPLPLADIDPGVIAVFIPIIALMIPIVVIFTNHQRRMAELFHTRNPQMDQASAMQLEALRREVAELKALMHQQAIAIDNLAPRLPSHPISDRLENVTR